MMAERRTVILYSPNFIVPNFLHVAGRLMAHHEDSNPGKLTRLFVKKSLFRRKLSGIEWPGKR
jgi:hypothetical protein